LLGYKKLTQMSRMTFVYMKKKKQSFSFKHQKQLTANHWHVVEEKATHIPKMMIIMCEIFISIMRM
jgi:hypothetical protein